MNKKTGIVVAIVAVICLGGGAVAITWVRAQKAPDDTALGNDHGHVDEDYDQTDSHGHGQEQDGHGEDDHDDHEGGHRNRNAYGEDEHGHGEHADEDRDDHGEAVRLTQAVMDEYGVKVAAASPGELAFDVSLPGEVVLNPDRVVHVVPRAPGIVRGVLKSMGDDVRAGEVLAWIESAELGEAKVDYLAKWARLNCCMVDLTRAQEVHGNTLQLLELLKSSPSLEELRNINGRAMGENRSILISAYAELVFAEAAYLRERPLFEKKVASERDYQAAEAEYKKADALYAATRDSIDFKVRRNLLEARRAQQVREIELNGAGRRLYVLGLTAEDIKQLELLAQSQAFRDGKESQCNDPNCKGCPRDKPQEADAGNVDLLRTEEKLAWYPLRAPLDGTVIEKHLTLGEKQDDDAAAFTIADLSTVWVHLTVYQKDLSHIRRGQPVTITFGHDIPDAQGVIEYVSPLVEEQTRTATARVVLENPHGEWRPGLFVEARVQISRMQASIRIPRTALLTMEDETVVFVESEDGFRPRGVEVGRSDENHAEITSGLAVGERYVSAGTFSLKAELVKESFAGGGHSH